MGHWQVNTLHNFSWEPKADGCSIECLQETRVFQLQAKDAADAIAQVMKYGAGSVIGIESITSVQSV